MKIVVLNPNTTTAMTEGVLASLAPHVPAATLAGLTARQGCAVIDSRETFAIGARTAVEMLAQVPADASAVLLACFGDPGLAEMRALTTTPVVGLAEAAIRAACDAGQPFAIVTAGRAWVAMLEECAEAYGAGALLVGVYALDGNGGALRREPAAFAAELARLALKAQASGARALILGGAAFAGLDFNLPAGLRLIDSFEAAALRLASLSSSPAAA